MSKTSFSFKMANLFFMFVNYKKPFKNEKVFERYLKRKEKENSRRYYAIYPVIKRLNCKREVADKFEYFVINPKGKIKILFIPGGSYIDNPTEVHWLFVEKLVKMLNAAVYMPIYRKLPAYSYNDSYPGLQKIYQIWGKKFILIADSAGGGLGLGLYYKNGENAFRKSILISPWVDISLENEEIQNIEPYDPILSGEGLKKLGKMWTKDEPTELTSPILGPINILSNLYVFAGTHEIFCPDIRRFVNLCDKNKNINYYEYENMNHGFVIHPIREAKEALKKILEILRAD